MKIKLEIKSTERFNKSGVSKRTGKEYSIDSQQAYLYQPNKSYPVECFVNLEEKQDVYPVGFYDLTDDSIYVDRFNNLTLGPKLVSLANSKAA